MKKFTVLKLSGRSRKIRCNYWTLLSSKKREKKETVEKMNLLEVDNASPATWDMVNIHRDIEQISSLNFSSKHPFCYLLYVKLYNKKKRRISVFSFTFDSTGVPTVFVHLIQSSHTSFDSFALNALDFCALALHCLSFFVKSFCKKDSDFGKTLLDSTWACFNLIVIGIKYCRNRIFAGIRCPTSSQKLIN